jgi:hypothetical protein
MDCYTFMTQNLARQRQGKRLSAEERADEPVEWHEEEGQYTFNFHKMILWYVPKPRIPTEEE